MKKIMLSLVLISSIFLVSCSWGEISEKKICKLTQENVLWIIKTPSTAVFQKCDKWKLVTSYDVYINSWSIDYLNPIFYNPVYHYLTEKPEYHDWQYIYINYLDAQNSYGAMLRSTYRCEIDTTNDWKNDWIYDMWCNIQE